MYDPTIIDTIERAQTVRPFCTCGRHTIVTYRDGAMWLECSITSESNGLRRLFAGVFAPQHVHERIVDLPPAARPVPAGQSA